MTTDAVEPVQPLDGAPAKVLHPLATKLAENLICSHGDMQVENAGRVVGQYVADAVLALHDALEARGFVVTLHRE